MNSDQFKGGLKEFTGDMQEGLGKLVGIASPQGNGVELQYEGRAQVHVGKLKEFEQLEIQDKEFDKHRVAWNNSKV